MTDWKKVQGSQPERPAEVDTTSSASTVYQRRNIEQITVTHDDTTTELWQYEEREMTREEYFILSAAESASKLADLETAMCEADMANAEWQAEVETALCELDGGE